jgi:hypothetical protein
MVLYYIYKGPNYIGYVKSRTRSNAIDFASNLYDEPSHLLDATTVFRGYYDRANS